MNEALILFGGGLLIAFGALFRGNITEAKEIVSNVLSGERQEQAQPQTELAIDASFRNLPNNRRLSQEEVINLANWLNVRYFGSRLNSFIIVAMAFQESGFDPKALRNESRGRKSIGLMQTLIGTAQEMYDRGYKALPRPNEQTLVDPYTSMYFGMAYFDRLLSGYPSKGGRGDDYYEWYVRAYNGGPGWERSQRGREMTQLHYSRVKGHLIRIFGNANAGRRS